MGDQLIVDTSDLRQGRMLIKVMRKNDQKYETVMFVYSDGNEGRLMLPTGIDIEAEFLTEIIRVLAVSYPNTNWKLTAGAEEGTRVILSDNDVSV